eukprot:2232348-Rhodomonas_salina.1
MLLGASAQYKTIGQLRENTTAKTVVVFDLAAGFLYQARGHLALDNVLADRVAELHTHVHTRSRQESDRAVRAREARCGRGGREGGDEMVKRRG